MTVYLTLLFTVSLMAVVSTLIDYTISIYIHMCSDEPIFDI